MSIFSLQVEKHVIGGLVNHPQIFPEVASFVKESDFYNETHSLLYCLIRDTLSKGDSLRIDKVILSEKAKNLGIKMSDDIDVFDYIDSICYTKISAEALFESCQELVKIRIRREIEETGDKLKQAAKTTGNSSIDEIIASCDSIYNEKVSAIDSNEKPINLFENIDEFIESTKNIKAEDVDLLTPYKEFNEMYGGLRSKNVYAFVSRPGVGKSTILADLCFKTSLLTGFKIKALYLDTEMETSDVRWRMLASLSGVPMAYLERGLWAKNNDLKLKIENAKNLMKHYEFDHIKVGNKTIDQVVSLVKRWYYSKVGRGNKCIVAYDYIKLTGEKISESWKEYQVIGEKIDKIKKLSEEINAPLLVAMQMNRSGESQNKKQSDVTDDSSAISTSDRLQWFASFVAIFRRKVIEEIAEDGVRFGTHKMIPLKTRFQGLNAPGHQDFIKRKFLDGTEKYVMNYLSYTVDNFKVEEKGSLRTILDNQDVSPKKSDNTEKDGEISL